MNRSLDLPDKTLQFIRDRPLMDEAARPLSGGPLLVKRGALLTRIVVDSVLALDGQRHTVMFIGTGSAPPSSLTPRHATPRRAHRMLCFRLAENGYVQKAVNYDGEMFVIEEIQVFERPVPISTLSLSATKVSSRFLTLARRTTPQVHKDHFVRDSVGHQRIEIVFNNSNNIS